MMAQQNKYQFIKNKYTRRSFNIFLNFYVNLYYRMKPKVGNFGHPTSMI